MKVDFTMNYLRRDTLADVNSGDLEARKWVDSQAAEIGADIQALVPKFDSEKPGAIARDIRELTEEKFKISANAIELQALRKDTIATEYEASAASVKTGDDNSGGSGGKARDNVSIPSIRVAHVLAGLTEVGATQITVALNDLDASINAAGKAAVRSPARDASDPAPETKTRASEKTPEFTDVAKACVAQHLSGGIKELFEVQTTVTMTIGAAIKEQGIASEGCASRRRTVLAAIPLRLTACQYRGSIWIGG